MRYETKGKRNIDLGYDIPENKTLKIVDNQGQNPQFIVMGKRKVHLTSGLPEYIDVEMIDKPIRVANNSVLQSASAFDVGQEVNAIIEKQNAIKQAFSEILVFKNEIDRKLAEHELLIDGQVSELGQKQELDKQETDGILVELSNGVKLNANEIQNIYSLIAELNQKAIDSDLNLKDIVEVLNKHEHPKATKESIGLGNADNTADIDKPVSKATQEVLDTKASLEDLNGLMEKITELQKKQKDFQRGIESLNWVGGVAGSELPSGGKKGYVLAKKSNKTGDYEWKAGGGGVSIHNDLEGRSAENAHPMSAITGLEDALDSKYDASNPSNYQTGTQVANSISVETTNRENADNGLQSQIDAITASSDVKDIVGTYAELQAYDTSTLGNNDIIKVLQDETHSDETTYYRWNTTTETFTLIGEEGPYYTKSEANSTFVPQTRTVNSKALSADITLTASDVGALPSSTTIGNGTLTIQKNGTTVQTFTANQTGNVTANITVPTDTGDLTNGAGYITGITSLMVTTALGYTPANVTALSDYVTIAGAETITGAKTFTEPVTIQNGQGTGCLLVGANVNSSNLTNNQRKLARINAPSYANKDLGATLIGWDTSGDSDSPVTNKSYDSVCFGGMKKITNCTSPMSITFCVTDTRAATSQNNKKYALAMDSNEAIFGVQPKYNGNNIATVNQIPTTASDVGALPDSTKYGADLSYSSDTLQLLDQDGNALGNPVTITSGSVVDIDGVSITKNGDDELQTVGVIDQNNTTTAIKTWTGTKAQYDSLVSGGTVDANTIYNITDDTNPTQALLEAIYPVGSIYIGTMNTCPLSALFGTWTVVGTKILTDMSTTAAVIGNGKGIGLTDGTNSYGLVGTNYGMSNSSAAFNTNVGTSHVASTAETLKTVGVVTDGAKSGIIADTSSLATELIVNIWQRTA